MRENEMNSKIIGLGAKMVPKIDPKSIRNGPKMFRDIPKTFRNHSESHATMPKPLCKRSAKDLKRTRNLVSPQNGKRTSQNGPFNSLKRSRIKRKKLPNPNKFLLLGLVNQNRVHIKSIGVTESWLYHGSNITFFDVWLFFASA